MIFVCVLFESTLSSSYNNTNTESIGELTA